MKILVTGGTGVIGEGLLPEFASSGHSVRLLSRHADEDAKAWNDVEPFVGDVGDASTITNAAEGCDAIVHIAGIVAEDPPRITFQSVNVDGTKNILAEAVRAGARRFLFVSSLGADIGTSDYHRSKLAAERLVQESSLDWTIVRTGNVYGPGDEVISLILKMVRVLPAVPMIDDGKQEFQPIWHKDLARMLAAIVERSELSGQILEAAGADVTTTSDLIERFATITGRKPVRLPVPKALAQLTSQLGSLAVDLPIDENKLTMLEEKNVIRNRSAAEALGIATTPLDEGLRKLADTLQESLPEEGFGSLQHKRFTAVIAGSRHPAPALMTIFKERINEVMPIEFSAESGAPERVEKGATFSGSLPLRGNFQVRVEVSDPTHVVFATIEGHPLAGIVEFRGEDVAEGVRFSVDVYTRAANFLDWLAGRTLGAPAQDANWRTVVQRMIDFSGGTSEGVHQEKQTLSEDEASVVEKRVRGIVQARHREESEERA